MTPAIHYDRTSDVLYVSFGTEEPSYAKDIDDSLILHMGYKSNLPTGFRLLFPRKMGLKSLKLKIDIPLINRVADQASPADKRERDNRLQAIEEILTNPDRIRQAIASSAQ